ncbi:small, acid-soluble spore protein L [Virgibacillus necropolis]|nr:small, acid-soluble spore protein L [Virgibacillus necropolis]
MSEKNDNYNKRRVNSSVNPQGNTEDVANQRPHSDLEDKAKKTNTKR